jgi:toxin ParE1/3/4
VGHLAILSPKTTPMPQLALLKLPCGTFKTLADTPGLGRACKFQNPRLKAIRSWRIKDFENYLIFYRAVAVGIQVNHVYHGARDIEALFDEK